MLILFAWRLIKISLPWLFTKSLCSLKNSIRLFNWCLLWIYGSRFQVHAKCLLCASYLSVEQKKKSSIKSKHAFVLRFNQIHEMKSASSVVLSESSVYHLKLRTQRDCNCPNLNRNIQTILIASIISPN